jgi:hypothetical protein
MVPAAFVGVPWAAKPDSLCAAVGKVGQQLAMIEGGVAHPLDDLVIRVRPHFLC